MCILTQINKQARGQVKGTWDSGKRLPRVGDGGVDVMERLGHGEVPWT